MLNIIANNKMPNNISNISGIPNDWNKSNYNVHNSAFNSMKNLIDIGLTKSKYILISYNDEGILTNNDWNKLFDGYNIQRYTIEYDTFKGCRNLQNRDNKVYEIMYLVSQL
jgi:adenine-specific DNA-methyltransferase